MGQGDSKCIPSLKAGTLLGKRIKRQLFMHAFITPFEAASSGSHLKQGHRCRRHCSRRAVHGETTATTRSLDCILHAIIARIVTPAISLRIQHHLHSPRRGSAAARAFIARRHRDLQGGLEKQNAAGIVECSILHICN